MAKDKIFKALDIAFAALLGLGIVIFIQPMDIMVETSTAYVSIKFFVLIGSILAYLIYYYAVKSIIFKKVKLCFVSNFCLVTFNKIKNSITNKTKQEVVAPILEDDEVVAPILEEDEIVAPILEDDEVVAPILEEEIKPKQKKKAYPNKKADTGTTKQTAKKAKKGVTGNEKT